MTPITMTSTSYSSNAEWLFNALDNADMTDVNECLDKFPVSIFCL